MTTKKKAVPAEERCGRCGEPQSTHRPQPGCLYNGWTNYETWIVKLWLDNEEGTSRYWNEVAQEVWNDATSGKYTWQTRESEATRELADRLKDEHEEASPAGVTGVFADLMSAAMSEVQWREIADALLDVVDKEGAA